MPSHSAPQNRVSPTETALLEKFEVEVNERKETVKEKEKALNKAEEEWKEAVKLMNETKTRAEKMHDVFNKLSALYDSIVVHPEIDEIENRMKKAAGDMETKNFSEHVETAKKKGLAVAEEKLRQVFDQQMWLEHTENVKRSKKEEALVELAAAQKLLQKSIDDKEELIEDLNKYREAKTGHERIQNKWKKGVKKMTKKGKSIILEKSLGEYNERCMEIDDGEADEAGDGLNEKIRPTDRIDLSELQPGLSTREAIPYSHPE